MMMGKGALADYLLRKRKKFSFMMMIM